MKKELFVCTREEKRHAHGGCVVLRVIADMPRGECRAAEHFAAMAERLCAWGQEALLPAAIEELENAVREGRLYSFSPHVLRIALRTAPAGRGIGVTLTATLTRGNDTLFHRTMDSFWDSAGRYQVKKPLNRGRKRRIRQRGAAKKKSSA